MAYSFRYINKQLFYSSISYTLLIEDDETKITTRIEKSFKCEANSIDEEFLRNNALIDINNIIEEKSIIQSIIEVTPDEAESDG